MAVKVGIQDLMTALQRAGVPFGNSQSMETASQGLGATVQNDLYSNDPALNALRSAYRSQLDQVAQADQALSKVYSDPNSPLFTNNVYAREKLISGAHNTTSNAVRTLGSAGKSRKSELDQEANQAESEYKFMTAVQKREEQRAAKLAKQGNKSTVAPGTNKKLNQSGLQDPQSIDTFLNAPAKFQDQFIRDYQRGKYDNPDKSVNDALSQYNEIYNPKKKTARTPEQNAKLLEEAFK